MREHFNDGVEFARFLAHRFVTDKAPNSAAALTYTTLFAVVPMMTVMFSMLSLIPAFHGMGAMAWASRSRLSSFAISCPPLEKRWKPT